MESRANAEGPRSLPNVVFFSTDVAQERDLIADRKYADTVTRLRAKFLRHNDHDDATFAEPRTTPPVVKVRD